jgi:hypothetical protein
MNEDFQDLTEKTLDFSFNDKTWTLREPNAEIISKWRGKQLESATFDGSGKPLSANKDSVGLPMFLVSQCLYLGDKLAGLEEVKKLPERVMSKCHRWLLLAAELISQADLEPEEAKKAEETKLGNS